VAAQKAFIFYHVVVGFEDLIDQAAVQKLTSMRDEAKWIAIIKERYSHGLYGDH
jgi:hypothetical protein